MATKWVAQMPVPATKPASAVHAHAPPLGAPRLLEDRESGEGGEQADRAGDEHQPEIMLAGDTGIDPQHGSSRRTGGAPA